MATRRPQPKKSRLTVYILLLAATAIVMGSLRTCRPDSLPPLASGDSKGDTLDVAIIYGPLSYYIWGDTLGGLNYDMLRLMGADMGRPVKFWPVVKVEYGLQRLEKGHYDMLASLPASGELKGRMLCTQSVFLDRMMLVQKRVNGKAAVTSALDLAGDTVHATAASSVRTRLENLSHEIGGPIEICEHPDLSEEYLCMKVSAGEFKYAVVNEKTALAMQERYPNLDVENPLSLTQFQVWVMQRTDTELLSAVDAWLKDFKKTARCRELLQRYSNAELNTLERYSKRTRIEVDR